MSKQTARTAARRNKHQQRQAQKLKQQQLVRRRRIFIISMAVAAVVLIAWIVFTYNRSQATATPGNTTNNGGSTSGTLHAPVDNVTCDTGEHDTYHVHSYLSLIIKGSPVKVPANIGIASDGSCFYWLHTHDDQGFIHVEAPQQQTFTLGSFIKVWEDEFPQLGYPLEFNQKDGWQVYVDGKLYNGDFHNIPLTSHTIVTMAYQSPDAKPVTTISWGDLTQ